jgi:hypothetical protein
MTLHQSPCNSPKKDKCATLANQHHKENQTFKDNLKEYSLVTTSEYAGIPV